MSTIRVIKDSASLGEQPDSGQTTEQTNVSAIERWISLLSGGALAVYGIIRLDWPGAGLAALGGALLYRGLSGHSYLYQAINVNTQQSSTSPNVTSIPGNKGERIQRTLTVNRPAQELYAAWRDVTNAPIYTPHITSVESTGERTSRWYASGPGGKTSEWNSELLQDIPNQLIAWHVHGTPLGANAGKVTFTPEQRGTLVTLEFDFFKETNPVRDLLRSSATALHEHETLETLRRFKEWMEAGEVASTHGQPSGREK